jgi:hypothetical protein
MVVMLAYMRDTLLGHIVLANLENVNKKNQRLEFQYLSMEIADRLSQRNKEIKNKEREEDSR